MRDVASCRGIFAVNNRTITIPAATIRMSDPIPTTGPTISIGSPNIRVPHFRRLVLCRIAGAVNPAYGLVVHEVSRWPAGGMPSAAEAPAGWRGDAWPGGAR